MFLKFDQPMANDQFVSILVMSYFRPEMTMNLLRSIHANADFPFEIILHDDHSSDEVQSFLFKEARPLVSTLILGQGEVNMGFASSANRATALCNSDYVLLANNDTQMVNPCLQLIKDVLDTPYVGSFGPTRALVRGRGEQADKRPIVLRNGRAFTLSHNADYSSVFAFRKSVWQENGGFPQVYNNGGDIAFLFSLLKKGYFHAGNAVGLREKSPEAEYLFAFRNLDQENQYKDSTGHIREFDQAYPRVFPYTVQKEAFKAACMARKHRRYPLSHEQYLAPEGHHNIDYWIKWMDAAYDPELGIAWDRLKDFGQHKFKAAVSEDLKAWRELA